MAVRVGNCRETDLPRYHRTVRGVMTLMRQHERNEISKMDQAVRSGLWRISGAP
jgi:hypothetical protein